MAELFDVKYMYCYSQQHGISAYMHTAKHIGKIKFSDNEAR
jgi:hypothetical protein